MSDSSELRWGPFCLQGRYGPLTRDGKTIKLQSKALAVLWTLAKQPGEVVSKSDLMSAVWPGTYVGESALSFQIQTLRRALDDDPRDPQYIQTVHRVGFRLRTAEHSQSEANHIAFVGRSAELDLLQQHLQRADAGQRQFVFISGEAGIGKTALIRQFLNTQNIATNLCVVTGQCTEHGGIGEAFLPILQAAQQLVRQAPDDRVFHLLKQMAPNWLVQMPALLEPTELASLARQTKGTPQARMLREMTEFLEAFSADQTLVLVLEDLHWSDSATLELLTRLAAQSEKARLLILCTLRPADAIVSNPPVRALQLVLRGRKIATDLMLPHLSASDVARYVQQQLGSALSSEALIAQIAQRSSGHPLFMVQIADYLRQAAHTSPQSVLMLSQTVPPGLRDLIQLQSSKLDLSLQQWLEIASVAGFEFTVASIAAVTGDSIEAIERQLEPLAKHEQFITDNGLAIWPDGTLSGRYRFRHALHQITLREQLPPARLARTHRLIAERLETAYGTRSAEVATELAQHFEQAGLRLKAATYCLFSARTSFQRAAAAEVSAQAERGLHLLETEPSGNTRELELALHTLAAIALNLQRSYTSSASHHHMTRIAASVDATRDPALLEAALNVLWLGPHMQARFDEALRHADRTSQLAEQYQLPMLHAAGLAWGAYSVYNSGRIHEADQRSQQGLKLISGITAASGNTALEAGCLTLGISALCRWHIGYPDLALQRAWQAVECTQTLGNPFAESLIRSSTLINILLYRREYEDALDLCEMALPLYERQSAHDALRWTRVQHGIARLMVERSDGALSALRTATTEQHHSGTLLNLPICYLHEAEYCLSLMRLSEGRAALKKTFELIERGVRTLESEALRLDGECLLLEHPKQPGRAEKRLQQALDMARERQILSLELRAAISLARFWHTREREADAHALLSGVLNRFTEGFDTRDLTDARTLLDEWAAAEKPKPRKKKT